jgi:hypothetical protein
LDRIGFGGVAQAPGIVGVHAAGRGDEVAVWRAPETRLPVSNAQVPSPTPSVEVPEVGCSETNEERRIVRGKVFWELDSIIR